MKLFDTIPGINKNIVSLLSTEMGAICHSFQHQNIYLHGQVWHRVIMKALERGKSTKTVKGNPHIKSAYVRQLGQCLDKGIHL